MLFRAGTSRGPFFLAKDLPQDPAERDAALLQIMGSGHPLCIDGIGGGDSLTNKVGIVSRSSLESADVDYLFAQIGIEEKIVDTKPNCGNMLSAVGPFAIERGLVPIRGDTTPVRVFNKNTKKFIDVIVQTPGGKLTYDGDYAIDGVPGQGRPIEMRFTNVAGAVTGKLLPTGRLRDVLSSGIEVSIIDATVPTIFIKASALGLRGTESAAEINSNTCLLGHLSALRQEAAHLAGMGDVSTSVLPKIQLVAPPATPRGTITGRLFVPQSCHPAYAVTGSVCIAAAANMPGTVVNDLMPAGSHSNMLVLEHPSGSLDIKVSRDDNGERAFSVLRTARKLFEGTVYYKGNIA
ncbi:PrpF protein [Blyttiomyces helicus]|uniref:PrpF protein n=1 Tax=Blyttiomyces helicus TaxID=388810 RepID=A0A4P9W975_9FUNG|nr:PrpF protein [Blyttiomyces helicus]|eukprot:RKO89101.1 PrpF protein [Blyttiomyces helicus]